MILNEKIPGLPKWPPIRFRKETGEYSVEVSHVSYPRYRMAVWLWRLIVLGYIGCFFLIAPKYCTTVGIAVYFVIFVFGPMLVIVGRIPVARIISRIFLPSETVVRFQKDQLLINGEPYRVVPSLAIQFRAFTSALSQKRLNDISDKLAKFSRNVNLKYEQTFMKVEMIYGARVVTVATISDEIRAQELAVGLQSALELAMTQESHPELGLNFNSKEERAADLPE